MQFSKGWHDVEPCYPLVEGPDPSKTSLVDPTVVDTSLDVGEVVVERNNYRVHPYVLPDDVACHVPEYGSDQFWVEFVDVVRRRTDTANVRYRYDNDDNNSGVMKDYFKHPDLKDMPLLSDVFAATNFFTAAIGAKWVHKDFPTELSLRCLNHVGFSRWRDDLIPSTNNLDFYSKQIICSELVGWVVRMVNSTAFALKWHFGQPRPEEVFAAWYGNLVGSPSPEAKNFECPQWVDAALRTCVESINFYDENVKISPLQDGNAYSADVISRAFTAYPEGCPNHPSAPAMHGGGAGTNLLLSVLMDFSDEPDIKRQIDLACHNWSHFRDDAGVHYASDSDLGLEVGARIIAATLPTKLAEFGADIDHVSEIIAANKVDWV